MITKASRNRSTRSRRITSGPPGQETETRYSAAWRACHRPPDVLGKALAQWQTVNDLGGQDTVSTQELAVIDLAVTTKLLLDSADAWLLSQPSLVDARKRTLLAAVLQRQRLADALARYLMLLGLKRRQTPLPFTRSLLDYPAKW